MYKRRTVVMLSTNQKAENCILIHEDTYRKDMYWNKHYMTQDYLRSKNITSHHLYIISDEEIKEGDWYLVKLYKLGENDNEGTWTVEQCKSITEQTWINKTSVDKTRHIDNCKKIIATTDKSLIISKSINGVMGNTGTITDYFPQPSQAFIQKYIEEYNKGNVITDVMVEYNKFEEPTTDGNSEKYIEYELKVSSDNTITIRRIKDSWNREEVIELAHKLLFRNTLEKQLNEWIEKNL